MKHLYIVKECISSSTNGIGTYINQLILCLADLDISIALLAFNSDREAFSIEKRENIDYYHFPELPSRDINRNHLIIDKFLRLYIKDTSNNFFLFNGSPCSSLMETVRKSHPLSKQIYVIHDMAWTTYLFGNLNQYLWILKHREQKNISERYIHLLDAWEEEIKMCTYADRILSLSEDTYSLLSNHYPIQKDKLMLIPNRLLKKYRIWTKAKKEKIKEKMLLEKNEKILLYVGRMTDQKGIYVYIEAFKEIVKKYPACRLVIVGDIHSWDEVQEKCHTISTHIHFTGHLPSEELEKWYQIADIGIFPFYTEQCSYVGLEMMVHGLPVVASDGFGVRCMFTNGNAKIAKIGKRNSTKGYKKELIRATMEILSTTEENKKKNQLSKR